MYNNDAVNRRFLRTNRRGPRSYMDGRIAPSKLLQDKSDFTEKRACHGTIY